MELTLTFILTLTKDFLGELKMEKITLNNGVEMPLLGFGAFQITDLTLAEQVVEDAIRSGYRLIDTASSYGNEEAIGQAIKNSEVDRTDIFVTTKLWVSDTGYEATKRAILTSLKKLQLDYLDLYLIHQPYGDVYGSWRAMEEAYQAGTIRAIGVSNFTADRVLDLELYNKICPAVDQIEVNPWMQQKDDVPFLLEHNIQPEAWAPFAEGKQQIFTNSLIAEIGQKYHKTVGQVILRWLLQRKIVVIPKSVHHDRIVENSQVFDFELTQAEMAQIKTLDENKSQFFDHRDPAAVQNIHDLVRNVN